MLRGITPRERKQSADFISGPELDAEHEADEAGAVEVAVGRGEVGAFAGADAEPGAIAAEANAEGGQLVGVAEGGALSGTRAAPRPANER